MDASPTNQDPNAQNPQINEAQTQRIPNKLILEVLKRLPVKSLKRFCCVSKTWLSLISSPKFIKDHLMAYLNRNDYTRHSLIFPTVDSSGRFPSFNVRKCPLPTVFDSPTVQVTKLHLPFECQSYQQIQLVGSCNGLVCVVVDGREIFLWNPCSNKCKKLPDFGAKTTRQDVDLLTTSYGLGYDEARDDFKVVGGCSVFFDDGKKHETLLKVYSGKTGGWRMIEHFNDGILDMSCYFVNGKFHWTASTNLQSPRAIVSVDAGDYRYGRVPEPKYEGVCSWTLGELNGCLSVTVEGSVNVDVWILKDSGVEKLWNKLLALPFAVPPRDLGVFIKPVVLSKDGNKVLCIFGLKKTLVCYNLKKNSREIIPLPELVGADVHVESLFSPNVNDEARPKIVSRADP